VSVIAFDNALAETTIGLFNTEAIGRGGPFLSGPLRTIDDVEYTTMQWIVWYDTRRVHSQLNYIPPDEYEANCYAHIQAFQHADPGPRRSFAKDAAPRGRRGQTRSPICG
jgi:putative transposase